MLKAKNYQRWMNLKNIVHNNNLSRPLYFHYKEGGIYNVYLGEDIGYEEDGKGLMCLRPFLILKGYSSDIFFGVPLTSKGKFTKYHYQLQNTEEGKQSVAILNQGRTLDIARIKDRKAIAVIGRRELERVRRRFIELIK